MKRSAKNCAKNSDCMSTVDTVQTYILISRNPASSPHIISNIAVYFIAIKFCDGLYRYTKICSSNI